MALTTNQSVRQVAYVVDDIRKAATRHASLFGSGPFFVAKDIPFSTSIYRGTPLPFHHSSAFGQWGDVMVEFMQREDDNPSVLTDVLAHSNGRPTLHHKAIIVDNPPATAKAFEAQGCPIAFHGNLEAGVEVFMIDTIDLYGHMIELYAPNELVRGFFAMVKDAAAETQDGPLLRDFSF